VDLDLPDLEAAVLMIIQIHLEEWNRHNFSIDQQMGLVSLKIDCLKEGEEKIEEFLKGFSFKSEILK